MCIRDRCRQNTIYTPIFTHHTKSWLLCTLVIGCLRFSEFCWVGKRVKTIMKPTSSPTRGQPNPRKVGLKSGVWANFFPVESNFFSGLGFGFYIGNRLQDTQPDQTRRKRPSIKTIWIKYWCTNDPYVSVPSDMVSIFVVCAPPLRMLFGFFFLYRSSSRMARYGGRACSVRVANPWLEPWLRYKRLTDGFVFVFVFVLPAISHVQRAKRKKKKKSFLFFCTAAQM